MKLFDYLERLKRLHLLIKRKQTGTPTELAKKFNLSTSHLYCIVDELKIQGAPIEYCRIKKSYYYSVPFEIEINCAFKILTDLEQQANGGYAFYKSNFHSDFIRVL
ncbi:hypothetical protein NF867_11735 [Solitalea sp. MAHUQ-68]|uniref:HTH domain-containing protein n=1 Tax=Solitalea agri TaxID=2953739 RepID=A0A9X2F3F9_9SPHI|nr:hypothetical protein [Solitalea agri]MCO4293535.1 hypothetical protein [Solitalea agri]